MEYVALDIEGCHFRVADLDALWVGACIQFATNRQAGFGRGGGDQFHHCLAAGQGVAPPSLSDVAKQLVLDFVPLRSAWRIITDLERQAGFVYQVSKLDLEQPHT